MKNLYYVITKRISGHRSIIQGFEISIKFSSSKIPCIFYTLLQYPEIFWVVGLLGEVVVVLTF